jgi:hypothetical protein
MFGTTKNDHGRVGFGEIVHIFLAIGLDAIIISILDFAYFGQDLQR